MATVKALVLKHHRKEDGTYNVKIRISHQRASKYLDTSHFVSEKQLKKDLSIKDNFLLMSIDKTINTYRKRISELDERLEYFDCNSLVEYLKSADEKIDFVSFSQGHIAQLREDGKSGSATNLNAVVNSLIDYFKRKKILITEITANMLVQYERYLRKPRTLPRVHRNGKQFNIKSQGLSDSGLYNHMRDLRVLFNAARAKYNDEDLGIIRIPHYPFKKYRLTNPPETKKRNLTVEQLKKIKELDTSLSSIRVALAKDLFLLSFYMCGTNSVDFFKLDQSYIKNGRLEFNRSKTKNKRKDNAFISLKIVKEAKPLLSKYLGKLSDNYSSSVGLTSALSFGMREIRKAIDIPDLTYYWARHTFATLARNGCRKSKDDVAMALNHVDEGRKTTDIYIAKDWQIVDEVQEAVIALLV